jgi:hypothetical protein
VARGALASLANPLSSPVVWLLAAAIWAGLKLTGHRTSFFDVFLIVGGTLFAVTLLIWAARLCRAGWWRLRHRLARPFLQEADGWWRSYAREVADRVYAQGYADARVPADRAYRAGYDAGYERGTRAAEAALGGHPPEEVEAALALYRRWQSWAQERQVRPTSSVRVHETAV